MGQFSPDEGITPRSSSLKRGRGWFDGTADAGSDRSAQGDSNTSRHRRVHFGETQYTSIPSRGWMLTWPELQAEDQQTSAEFGQPISKEEMEQEEEVNTLVNKFLVRIDQRRSRRSIAGSLEQELLTVPKLSGSKLWTRRGKVEEDAASSSLAVSHSSPAPRSKPSLMVSDSV
mmetsp:Transcript_32225/g.75693  ORF Transcript_32225/g.75693 Transcript_32225/m.75693 type:complete len:173 (-) Transcript_32225:65-583(-)